MIDITLLRLPDSPFRKNLLKKEPSFDIEKLLRLDQSVRDLKTELDNLRKEKNDLAKKASGGITDQVREQSIAISKNLKEKEALFLQEEEAYKKLLLACPNIPQKDLPEGNKESNKVILSRGEGSDLSTAKYQNRICSNKGIFLNTSI